MPANDRMDGIVEKATELGRRLHPAIDERALGAAHLRGQGGQAPTALASVAVSAAEQCGRVRAPDRTGS